MRAVVELNEQATRICVYFKYDPQATAAIKEVPGRRAVWDGHKFKHWTVPADLATAKRLREVFGPAMQLGDGVRAWGKHQQVAARRLAKVAGADDAELRQVDEEASAWLRPYQRADVAMMAATNVLNTNQPGTGKTVEVVYATQEAGVAGGAHLVIAPITLHKDPWADELAAHAPAGTRVHWADHPKLRLKAMHAALADIKAGHPTWLVVNPDMIRAQRAEDNDTRPVLSRDHKGNAYVAKADIAPLFQVQWATLTLDEFHKYGLGENRNTLFARAVDALGRNAGRRYALSGTPMGGKPIRLWGVLHFIEPQLYSSKWRWAEHVAAHRATTASARQSAASHPWPRGRVPEGARQAHGAPRPRRRAARAAAQGGAERGRAHDHQAGAHLQPVLQAGHGGPGRWQGQRHGCVGRVARLKQLANALCTVDEEGKLWPTRESGKLPVLLDRLDTHGCGAGDAAQPGARAMVASESQRMVRMTAEWLVEQGINARVLDGKVVGAKRTAVLDWYKQPSDDARVLVMTTQTGGVGLNLGMTGSIHMSTRRGTPTTKSSWKTAACATAPPA